VAAILKMVTGRNLSMSGINPGVVPEVCREQVHVPKKERRKRRIIIITRIGIGKQYRTSPHPIAPNSKNDDDYQFARPRSTWKPNFAQIRGFLYFGGHYGFKMAAIANQKGRHMVQHLLLPVNIHFH
jgi:hypothetical protein